MSNVRTISVVDESVAKLLHIEKVLGDAFIFFPGQSTLYTTGHDLRIFIDNEKKKLVGHGAFVVDEHGMLISLFLDYNIPERLDLENGKELYLRLLYPLDQKNIVLDSVLGDDITNFDNDNTIIMDIVLRQKDVVLIPPIADQRDL